MLSSYIVTVFHERAKRPYESLQPSQKRERRREAREAVAEVLERVGCPLQAIAAAPTPSAAELIHLPTSVRDQIRTVPSLRIPSEQSIIACKHQLAGTHATETGTFANGAFVTDPVRFVSVLCAQSPFIVVGGDSGGGHTKLGITYSYQSVQHFAALLVYEGSDGWEELNRLTNDATTPFVGESSSFPHLFAFLQHLIDERSAFLNGDWPFINAVLGLMSPAATHPCPICIVTNKSFLSTSRYRTRGDKQSVDPTHRPLLTISPERIVPTPLHLFLGISNRIILDAFSELVGEAVVREAVQTIKTIHSAGCGGRSDLYDLNGPEISKFIKKKCSTAILAAVDATSTTFAATRASHSILSRWLQQLHHSLLHSGDWEREDLEAWRSAVGDIHRHWESEAHSRPFPKLHMLHHTIDFAERHRFLGRVSESQIESYHATFNSLFHKQHRNQSHNTTERLRRALADTSLRAVQPMIAQ